MNRNTRHIVIFLLVISISFMPFIGIYSMMIGIPDNIAMTMLMNLPVCFFIGTLDYLLIEFTRKWISHNFVRIIIDLIVTTFTTALIICLLNFFLMHGDVEILLRSALPAIPWNWVVMLIIELYFYNIRQQETERDKSRYQLIALRNQINPHFLFNSLNVLSSLAYTDAEKANIFAKRLSAVFRYLLANNENKTVSIDEELEFIKKYIYLEKVRFGDSLKIRIWDERRSGKGRIIPVSVQMLVENAIKHNICTTESPLKIDIIIDDSHVKVVNNSQRRQLSGGTGIGLKNISQQYALYNSRIAVAESDGAFSVTLPVIR